MLLHYSADPLGELKSMEQAPMEMGMWSFADKPKGLWVSVDDEWATWCLDHKFHVGNLARRYHVVVAPDSLLLLKTDDEIEQFQLQYGVPALGGLVGRWMAIDWSKVAEQHAGIVIAPYQWRCRMDMLWYYGWDCASGCIWDTSVIERVERYPIGAEFVKGRICSTCEGDPYDTVSKTYCPTCEGTGVMP